MKIRYLPTALEQLDDIFSYLNERNPASANRVKLKIKQSIDQLADFPLIAKESEVAGIRELTIVRYPYVIHTSGFTPSMQRLERCRY